MSRTAHPDEPTVSVPATSSPMPRAIRLGKYAFWHSLGMILPLGLDRLFICPALNRHLGHDVFGGFIWVIGIMNLFGNIGANGFAILLMRNLAKESADGARRTVRTALLLSGGLTCVILTVASLGSLLFANDAVRSNAAALYVPLGIYALLRSGQLIVIADLRIKRRFVSLFVLKLLEGVALLGVLLVAPGGDLWVIGMIYAGSILFSLPVIVATARDVLDLGCWWDSRVAKALMSGWYAGALLTIADQAQVYASRVLVGVLNGGAEVAVLYAGTSIGNLFVFPVGLLGSLLLSLLASQTTFSFAGRAGRGYLWFVGATAVGVGVLSFVIGRPLIRALYPELAPATMTFYHWLAFANGCSSVRLLMRPVAVKFAEMPQVVLLSSITLFVQLGALAVLVPIAAARGAAIALALSSALAAVLWLLYFARLGRQLEEHHARPDDSETLA